jgi:hypothetical protein
MWRLVVLQKLTFRRNILPPASRYKKCNTIKGARSKKKAILTVNFYRTVRCQIPEDRTFYIHRRDNLIPIKTSYFHLTREEESASETFYFFKRNYTDNFFFSKISFTLIMYFRYIYLFIYLFIYSLGRTVRIQPFPRPIFASRKLEIVCLDHPSESRKKEPVCLSKQLRWKLSSKLYLHTFPNPKPNVPICVEYWFCILIEFEIESHLHYNTNFI